MSSDFDWEKYEKPSSKSNSSFDWEKYEKKQEPLTLKGSATAYGSSLAGGAGGLVPDVLEMTKPVQPFVPALSALSDLSKLAGFKTTPELTEQISKSMGGEEPQNALERILQQSGEFGGQEALIGTAAGGPVGGALGLAHGSTSGILYGGLKELGLDDKWALGITALATLSPIAAQKLIPKLISKFKPGASFEEAVKTAEKENLKDGGGKPPPPPGGSFSFERQKMPSGITEPRSVKSELPQFATITPERQKYVIDKLNKEAKVLTEKAIEKHLPLAAQIEEGFDFHEQFERGFGKLKKTAEKANPQIDVTPIMDLMEEQVDKYKGIPTPHDEARMILKEVKNYRKLPITSLKNILKIFRSNNKKLRNIYEKSRIEGKKQEYADFLIDMNKAITKSFENTFPKNSEWVNEFKNLNSIYKNFLDTKKTLNQLKGILSDVPSIKQVKKLAMNEKSQNLIRLSMGEAGGNEVIQIAKDLDKAISSIKKIPTRDLKVWDYIFPVGLLIPFVKIPATAIAAYRGIGIAKNLYGYWLSTPARRRAYDQALKAINDNNQIAYKEATNVLKKELPDSISDLK